MPYHADSSLSWHKSLLFVCIVVGKMKLNFLLANVCILYCSVNNSTHISGYLQPFYCIVKGFFYFIFHFFTGCFLISKLEPQAAIQVANGFEATTIFLSFLIFLQGGIAITPDYPQHYLQR